MEIPPHYDAGTVQIDEEGTDVDDEDFSEADANESVRGVKAEVSLSPAQLESLLKLTGVFAGGVVRSVLGSALCAVWLL